MKYRCSFIMISYNVISTSGLEVASFDLKGYKTKKISDLPPHPPPFHSDRRGRDRITTINTPIWKGEEWRRWQILDCRGSESCSLSFGGLLPWSASVLWLISDSSGWKSFSVHFSPSLLCLLSEFFLFLYLSWLHLKSTLEDTMSQPTSYCRGPGLKSHHLLVKAVIPWCITLSKLTRLRLSLYWTLVSFMSHSPHPRTAVILCFSTPISIPALNVSTRHTFIFFLWALLSN